MDKIYCKKENSVNFGKEEFKIKNSSFHLDNRMYNIYFFKISLRNSQFASHTPFCYLEEERKYSSESQEYKFNE